MKSVVKNIDLKSGYEEKFRLSNRGLFANFSHVIYKKQTRVIQYDDGSEKTETFYDTKLNKMDEHEFMRQTFVEF